MAKTKIRYVKFVFTPKNNIGTDWKNCPEPVIGFGNRHTDTWNTYQFNQNYISTICSDFLKDDKRRWQKHAKFSEAEASILLLKYLEQELKEARQNLKDVMKTIEKVTEDESHAPHQLHMWDYSLAVYKRGIKFHEKACKIWRKKVREIKKSPEYMWEQLLK